MSATSLETPRLVERLYLDHQNWLAGWLRSRLGCEHRAADLTHDTFIRLLTARQMPTINEPRAFLTTVAKRVLFNHYRRQDLERAWLETLMAMPAEQVPSEEDKAIVFQTLVELDTLLDGLPRAVKHAFLLAQLDGASHGEIAQELGISLATVKRHLKKAAMHCYFAL